MTNPERQADFRRRHPDYNRQYKARMRAAVAALQEAAKVKQAAHAWTEQLIAPPQLCLPAPVVVPVIVGMNAIEAVAVRTLASIRD